MAGQDYKTLREVARDIQSNLQKYAPIDTGNLRNKLRSTNTINAIIGKKPTSSKTLVSGGTTLLQTSFSVDVAPNGAEYGLWFNDPPAVKSKRRQSLKKTAERKDNWDFGQRAIDDAIKSKLDEIAKEIQENVVDDIYKELDNL